VVGGRVVVVSGADSPIGSALADGLRDGGLRVATTAGHYASRAAAVDALDTALAVAGTDGLDAYVHVPIAADSEHRGAFADLDADSWDRGAEAVLRGALWACQAAHGRMCERGGRIVLVTSTAGLVGAAEHAPFTCATEGVRSLAKVAARQWGAVGISVNCVAVAMEPVADGPLPPALGHAADVRRDLASVVAMLVGDAGGAITGVTIPVDGGVVMTP
jgi:3-oxoacyl-[acyl-carrier protein] reductase